MANTANTKGCCLTGCLTSIIGLVVVVALIFGGVYYVMGMTFDELGIADEELFEGQTLRTLGLADVKVRDALAALRELFEPVNESDIVTNPFDPVQSAANVDDQLGGILPSEGGELDFGPIFEDQITTGTDRYLVTLQDTDIAYILNTVLEEADSEEIENVEAIPFEVKEVTIQGDSVYGYSVKIIFKIDLTEFTSEILQEVPSYAVGAAGAIPDAFYLTAINDITVDSEGILTTSANDIYLNQGQNNILNQLIFGILSEAMQEEGGGEEEVTDALVDALGEGFRLMINNIGEVGTADTIANNLVDDHSSIDLGEIGVSAGQISMITRMDEIII